MLNWVGVPIFVTTKCLLAVPDVLVTSDEASQNATNPVSGPSIHLSCNDCFARLDVYVERRIQEPDYDDPAMRAHLTGCSACDEEADTLLALLTLDAG